MISYKASSGIKRFIATMMLTAVSGMAFAGEGEDFVAGLTLMPSTQPVLQINSGRHNGLVTVMSTDRQGRYLVTASEDKTLRLWSLQDGKLLQTYRMLVGSEHQGKLYAAAISPDGRYIAAGGYLGHDWEFSFSIFIIERESGKVVKRIKGLDYQTNHLVFSQDGHHLAGLFGQGGLKVWDARNDFVEVAKDTDYKKSTYWADFSSSGELVTTSEDGFIRLYDSSFKLKKKAELIVGKTPVGAAFSPDGSQIVVGFLQAHSIVVASANDLSIVIEPDVSGIINGDIAVVKWGRDNTIYAAGTYDKQGVMQMRRWTKGGRGNYRDSACGESTVMDFNILLDGRVISVDANPEISMISTEGEFIYQLGSGAALHSIVGDALMISDDGTRASVTLWGKQGIGKQLRFDTAELTLDSTIKPAQTLHAAIVQSELIKVKGWHGGSKPTVNGTRLDLAMFERSNALAISVDSKFFLLGTSSALRRYADDGTLVWKVDLDQSVRSLNMSANGKIAVVVLGDDTMRWYNPENGQELLALFIHADTKRWVAWTAEGYFSHSDGGANLAGYLLSIDKDSLGLFVSFKVLDEQLNRPDKLRAKMKGEKIDNMKDVIHDLISNASRGQESHAVKRASGLASRALALKA